MNTTEKKKQKVQYEELLKEEKTLKVEEPALTFPAKRYSYADYLTWTDEVMREIIDGVVYLFSAPVRKHAKAVSNFLRESFMFLEKRKSKCEIYTAPFDVRFPKNGETADDKIFNVVQPDICVICDPSKLDDGGCLGAPDLIVEVISPSTSKRDLDFKFSLYEESGVKEYWVVYPNDKAVNVFILQPNGKYDKGKTYEVIYNNTQVPVKTLKGLVIDLNELFE